MGTWCPNCKWGGNALLANYCSLCGTKLEEQKEEACSSCGKKFISPSRINIYCDECGTKLVR